MVLVGIVARTHGNRGQVIVNSHSDFPETRFRPGATLYARTPDGPIEALQVTSARSQQGRPILGFDGFSSIGDAERLAGAELKVPASEQEALPEGSFYYHELIGCDVVTAGGDNIGKVVNVEGTGAASRLVVKGTRREVLIPLAQEICAVDVHAKRIVVRPLEGLLEVNGDWRG